jgi:hypothetical protein
MKQEMKRPGMDSDLDVCWYLTSHCRMMRRSPGVGCLRPTKTREAKPVVKTLPLAHHLADCAGRERTKALSGLAVFDVGDS